MGGRFPKSYYRNPAFYYIPPSTQIVPTSGGLKSISSIYFGLLGAPDIDTLDPFGRVRSFLRGARSALRRRMLRLRGPVQRQVAVVLWEVLMSLGLRI